MKRIIPALVLLSTLLTACNLNYKKTPSGLRYKIISTNKNGKPVTPTSFVKFNVEYTLERDGKDTVIISNFGKLPSYGEIDTTDRAKYSFVELLPKTKVGDSVIFVMSVDSLINRKQIPETDPMFKRGNNIRAKAKIIDVFATQEAMMKDIEIERNKLAKVEAERFEKYFASKKINAVKTKNGAYVEILKEGAGTKADSGKLVTVNYTGRLLENDKVFDSNTDKAFGHVEPFPFVVGTQRVIQGWDEALPYLSKGAKARVYIPFQLGYGPNGNGPIPPYSNLIFDIEVLDVQDAPAQDKQQWNIEPEAATPDTSNK